MIKNLFFMGRVFVVLGLMSSVTLSSAQTYAIELPLSGESLLLTQKAENARHQGKYKEARALIQEARRLRPDSGRIAKLQFKIQTELASAGGNSRGSESSSVSARAANAGQTAGQALTQRSSASAQMVYDLISRGDLAAAVAVSEKAHQQFPTDQAVATAHVNALVAHGQHLDADSAVGQMISRFGMSDELLVLRQRVHQQVAMDATYQAYLSLEKKDTEGTIRAASQSIAYAPDVMENRLLLIHSLLNAGRYEEAQQAANEAIAINRADVLPLMMRAYALQYLGQRSAAITDFERVLTQFDLTWAEQSNYRLIMADAALVALEPQVALDLLKPLAQAANDPANNVVTWRRRAALEQLSLKAAGEDVAPYVLEPLNWVCQTTPDGRVCDVQPAVIATDPAYANASAAFLAIASKDYPAALTRARRAVHLDPDNFNYQGLLVDALVLNGDLHEADRVATAALTQLNPSASLLAKRGEVRLKLGQTDMANQDFSEALNMASLPLVQSIQLLVKVNRQAEAKVRLDDALKSGITPVGSYLDLAYLSIAVGDDARAIEAFQRSDAAGQLTGAGLLDAAYTAVRSGHDAQALDYLSRVVDDFTVNPLTELKDSATIDTLLNARRLIADLSRNWGLNASVSYRGATPESGQLQAGTASTQSVQLGSELFWRPFGYRNGRLLEVYARAFETVSSSAGGLIGRDSLQGSVGIRWKPLSESSLILALGRLFPVTSKVESDWLAQIAYSGGVGGELRPETSWWAHQYYAEAGRYLEQQQTYVTGNARWGRNFRLKDVNPDLVVFPHVVLAGDYNSDYVQRTAVGAGLGVQFRYWYRQDLYNAHRSYLDFVVQYRAKVQGDKGRAGGVFLNLQMSY